MFAVQHFDAAENHKWLVRKYECFRFDGALLSEKYIPRPDISVIFHFRATPIIVDDTEIWLEPFFAAPILPRSLLLKFRGTMDSFVVACKPTVLSRVFKIDLTPVAGRSIELPHDIFYPLWSDLSKLATTQERIEHFAKFVDSRSESPYAHDAVDRLYDILMAKGVTTTLKDIMKNCSASQRTLERHFIKRTGVSPKTFVRILRIDYLWNKINHENAVDYQELVFGGGYYDQAHFINDFKAIVGETPGYFFKRNQTIRKMFSGRVEGMM